MMLQPDTQPSSHASSPSQLPRVIVASFSTSPRNAAVAAEAAQLARVFDARLHLVHAGTDDQALRQHLRDALRLAGVRQQPQLTVREGRPDRVVCQVAREVGADLIVGGVLRPETTLAAHARSTAGRIAIDAPCHVILLRHPRLDPAPARRVMAAVGLDDGSRGMLRWLIAWSAAQGAEAIDVVHEQRPWALRHARTRSNAAGVPTSADTPIAARQALDALVGECDFGRLRSSAMCLHGSSGWDALAYAAFRKADLLCLPVTPRGMSFWQRLIDHGLDFDLHAVPCSLLLYRAVNG